MHVRTLPEIAAALGTDFDTLTRIAVDHLQEPLLAGDRRFDNTIRAALERYCAAIQCSDAGELASWARIESARLGRTNVREIVRAAAFAIASRATGAEIDRSDLLAHLAALSICVNDALGSPDGGEAIAESRYPESAETLLTLLDEHDASAGRPGRAAGQWAKRIAVAMGLSSETAAFIELCALLRDVGKISTPNGILRKNAALTGPEWKTVREHSIAGQRVLERVPALRHCTSVVRAHHERWDGTGYPDGWNGDAIPIEARVVAVADAFHAMISERPYRKALAPRHALDTLRAGAGTQWDPRVVDAMLRIFAHVKRAETAIAYVSSA
ncbi:MAG: HD-GYP domain-containing protein [Rhodanobacteraceae bacterium]